LRNPDPAPIVLLALAAEGAATAATRDAIRGRGTRADQRAGELARTLAGVPPAIAAALSNPRALAWSFYESPIALNLARASATGIHLRCQRAFQEGREMRPQPPRRPLLNGLAKLERRQVPHLRALRQATIARKFDTPLELAAAVTADVQELAALCKLAGRAAGSDHERAAEVALQASDLARRHAALVAGAILIDKRLRDRRRAKPAADAARRATKIRRTPLNPGSARKTVRTSDRNKRLTVVAQLGKVGYVERPRKPYSGAEIDGDTELRVPYKNMRRVGVVQGSWVVAAGKVKVAGQDRALEVEFEGPGQHRGEYFEDWVFDLARPAYDLYPGVLRMTWDFPDPKVKGGGADLLSRIDYRARA
jgi:hypothetical protein